MWQRGRRARWRGKIGHEPVELAIRARVVGRVETFEELVLRKSSLGVRLAQDCGNPVAIGVGRTHLRWLDHEPQYRGALPQLPSGITLTCTTGTGREDRRAGIVRRPSGPVLHDDLHGPVVGDDRRAAERQHGRDRWRPDQAVAGVETPREASRDAPPSSAVSTHGPSAVTATVCSKCADNDPSAVVTVHSSSWSSVSGPPRLIIGSMASTSPGTSFGPRARVW